MLRYDLVYSCTSRMYDYTQGKITIDELQNQLQALETKLNAIWFKFGKDDALAHTIADVINGLKSPTNRELYLDYIKAASTLDLNAELQVHEDI